MAPTPEELKEEDRKIRHLRRLADFTAILIIEDSGLALEEASAHVAHLKAFALKLFPDKGEVFDLVYSPRFKKLLIEKYRLS